MKMKEVHDLNVKTHDKRHEILQKIKFYFEERGFVPTVRIDDIDRVYIKIAYPRRTPREFPNSKDVTEVYLIGESKEFQEEFGIELIWSTTTISTQYSLPEDVRDLWETEFIYH